AITIIRPETLVRWHRAGFRRHWRWKSRSLGGRPKIDAGLPALIRRMSAENPLWGAPRLHGELLKLGFDGAQSSVAKSMVERCGPPSQGWRTFLRNRTSAPWTHSLFRPLDDGRDEPGDRVLYSRGHGAMGGSARIWGISSAPIRCRLIDRAAVSAVTLSPAL